jgi:hypothetical protein
MSLPDTTNIPELVTYWISFAEKNQKDMRQQLAELHLKTNGTRRDLFGRLLEQYKEPISNDKNIVQVCNEIKSFLDERYSNKSVVLGDHGVEKCAGNDAIWKRFKEWMKRLLLESGAEATMKSLVETPDVNAERSRKRRRVTEGEVPKLTENTYTGVPPGDLFAVRLTLSKIMHAYLAARTGPNLPLENEVAQIVTTVQDTDLRTTMMSVLFPAANLK